MNLVNLLVSTQNHSKLPVITRYHSNSQLILMNITIVTIKNNLNIIISPSSFLVFDRNHFDLPKITRNHSNLLLIHINDHKTTW